MEVAPAGDVLIRFSRVYCLLYLAFFLPYTAGAAWLCVVPLNGIVEPHWPWRGAGLVGVLMGGLGTLMLGYWLFSRKAGLLIDRDGIFDGASFLGHGRIRWQDVRATRVVSILGLRILVVDLHDPRQFIERGNLAQHWLKAMHGSIHGSPVILPLTGLGARAHAVSAIVDQFFDRAMGRRVSPSN